MTNVHSWSTLETAGPGSALDELPKLAMFPALPARPHFPNPRSHSAMDITKAQAMILREAIAAASTLITGDVDGKKRVPWDNHAMDAGEGKPVPAEITTETGYWALLNELDDRLADIETGIAQ